MPDSFQLITTEDEDIAIVFAPDHAWTKHQLLQLINSVYGDQ